MFSLIISIIAIALVAALAGASVYYGGSAFNQGTEGADASTLINSGQQINGANALATADGVSVGAIGDLTPDYLTQEPSYKGASFSVVTAGGDDFAELFQDSGNNTVITQGVCEEINERAGTSTAMLTGADPDAAGVALFGCYETTTGGDYHFAYRM